MDKKKIFIAVIIIVIILAIILLIFKSCNPREKAISTEEEEYSAFIKANVEFTCEILKNPELANDPETSEDLLKKAYGKYYFPIDDDAAMMEILKKYENNLEIAAIIKENSASCAN